LLISVESTESRYSSICAHPNAVTLNPLHMKPPVIQIQMMKESEKFCWDNCNNSASVPIYKTLKTGPVARVLKLCKKGQVPGITFMHSTQIVISISL